MGASGDESQGMGRRASSGWYGYLVIASLLFVLIYLYRVDHFAPVTIHSPLALAWSVAFLLAGFLGQGMAWFATVNESGFKASLSQCLAGSGLSIFTKYIPGKVFVVLGRAAYLTQRLGYPLSRMGMISLTAQLMALWTGLTLGTIGLLLGGGLPAWKATLAVVWVGLTIVVFSDVAHAAVERAVRLLLGKQVSIPSLRLRSVLTVMPWFFAFWISWAIGFQLLLVALRGDAPIVAGLGFPFATTVGIVAVFAPGGLGVVEGVLVAFLVSVGFGAAEAATLSVVSRLWFLLGEACMFGVGLAASRRHRSGA